MASNSLRRELTAYFLFLLLLATCGPLLFGYHLAELNAPSEVITCQKKSINPAISSTFSRIKDAVVDHIGPNKKKTGETSSVLPQCIPMDAAQFGVVSSTFTLGGLLGALAAGPVTARAGRIRTMLYAAIAATLGPVFEALAPNIGTMAFGRFISGLGAGAAMVVCPLYIFDIAPPGRKGFFGSFTQVMVNAGILIAQAQGLFLSKGNLWRIILGVGGAIGLAQAMGFVCCGQESPRWMAHNGNAERARRVLRTIRGEGADIDAEVASWGVSNVDASRNEEEESLLARTDDAGLLAQPTTSNNNPDHQKTLGAFAVLRHPDTRFAVFAICMIMMAQQFTGINSIVMYGVSLLSSLLAANSAILNVAVSALNVIMTVAAATLVDRLGRKTCLLMSTTGMGTSSLLLAIGIKGSFKILSAISVTAFVVSFALGLGPVPFLLASELVPSNAVGATQSWALAVNWIATFCVAQFFPILNELMGKGEVYFIFTAFAICFFLFIAIWVPESKGKADADEVWGRGKNRERVD
jgi:sugar porter (SP) family MFS transporter